MSTEKPKTETTEVAPVAKGVAASEALDEAKINAPSMQEIVMLSAICIATLIMWAAGRAACNYHVPGESLTPREVSLEDRTRMPKDVGIEFAQSLSGGDFEIAKKLAKGEALSLIDKEKAACKACPKSDAVREKILSVGTILEANSVDTIVSVRTITPEGEKTRVFGIEREERLWKVTRVFENEEDAELKPAPASKDAMHGQPRPGEDGDEEDSADPKGDAAGKGKVTEGDTKDAQED